MPVYESIFIINPNQTDDETNALIKKMQDIVAKQSGEIVKFEDWGKKKLAYELRKQKRGHYVFFQIKGAPAVVAELERNYKMSDAIIKFLTVKLEKELRPQPPPKPKKAKKEEAPSHRPARPSPPSAA